MQLIRLLVATIATTLALVDIVDGDVLLVPAEYPTIQEAIEAAVTGDEIEIAAGTYLLAEPIDTMGKAIEIRGVQDGDGTPLTIVDGSGVPQPIRIWQGEASSTILRGLEIVGGTETSFGGVIRVVDSSPAIIDCTIKDGFAFFKGGGLLVQGSGTPLVQGCLFLDNGCGGGGGAIFVDDDASLTVEESVIQSNTAQSGAGIYVNGFAEVQLSGSTICSNTLGQISGPGQTVDLGGNVIGDSCDCPTGDLDSDQDGTPDCEDLCPNDPAKTEPGDCGCGVSDIDSDADGTPDCDDLCPNDPAKTEPGDCG